MLNRILLWDAGAGRRWWMGGKTNEDPAPDFWIVMPLLPRCHTDSLLDGSQNLHLLSAKGRG